MGVHRPRPQRLTHGVCTAANPTTGAAERTRTPHDQQPARIGLHIVLFRDPIEGGGGDRRFGSMRSLYHALWKRPCRGQQ